MQWKIFVQGEMQQLRDKLAIAERTARSEAQIKVKRTFVFNLNKLLRQLFIFIYCGKTSHTFIASGKVPVAPKSSRRWIEGAIKWF